MGFSCSASIMDLITQAPAKALKPCTTWVTTPGDILIALLNSNGSDKSLPELGQEDPPPVPSVRHVTLQNLDNRVAEFAKFATEWEPKISAIRGRNSQSKGKPKSLQSENGDSELNGIPKSHNRRVQFESKLNGTPNIYKPTAKSVIVWEPQTEQSNSGIRK